MQTAADITSVRTELKTISLEANVVANMVDSVKNIFPTILEKLSSSFSKVETLPEPKIAFAARQRDVLKHLDSVQYLDMAELAFGVPEGFKGSLLEYFKTLNAVSKNLSGLMQNTLQPYTVYLSQYISNKEMKLSTRDMTSQFSVLRDVRKENITAVNQYIGSGFTTRVKIGKVISRKPEIEQIYREAYLLSQTINDFRLIDIKKQVKKSVDLLNIIIDQAKQGSLTNVTPEAARNLAFGATEIANEVEFLSVFYFRALGAMDSCDNLTNTLFNYLTNNH